MRWLLLALALGGTPDAGHVHCWHSSSIQHSVPNHVDEVCCHCGEGRCREAWPAPRKRKHGPHAPPGF